MAADLWCIRKIFEAAKHADMTRWLFSFLLLGGCVNLRPNSASYLLHNTENKVNQRCEILERLSCSPDLSPLPMSGPSPDLYLSLYTGVDLGVAIRRTTRLSKLLKSHHIYGRLKF